MKKNFLILMCITIISFGLIYSADATPILTISDGTDTVSITDNVGLDESNSLGVIKYSGSVGIYNMDVVWGITVPVIGTVAIPQLYLHSFNVVSLSNIDSEPLTVSFSESGFGTSDTVLTGFQTDVGGFTQGSVSFNTYFNDTEISNLDFLSAGFFSDSITYTGSPLNNPFSLTAVATIDHIGMNTSSFYANISSIADSGSTGASVPEPGIIILLGMGLLGIGIYNRRRKQL